MRNSESTNYEAAKLLALTDVVEGLGTHVTTQALRVFAIIAAATETEMGLPLVELERRAGLISSSRTRIVQQLGIRRTGDKGSPGLGLVATARDPDGTRGALIVLLTPKGRRLWSAMKHAVE